ncbi:2-hydroxyacyl-CoA dehydratase, partial [bacterium]|nr:2-hydroxyacyl-CoA dehydratase [bacterium]
RPEVRFYHPFVSLRDRAKLAKRLCAELKDEELSLKEIDMALRAAYAEQERYRDDVRRQGELVLKQLFEQKQSGIVLLGRPYHIDPEVNHGLPQLIQSLGWAVLSEDCLEHLAEAPNLRVINQWEYHSRLYRAAHFAAQNRDYRLEAVQLNSFGCGLDAVTIEQVQEIMSRYGCLHTVIKLDSINNLGAARIRLRSLRAALREKQCFSKAACPSRSPEFVKSMRRDYTILAPQVAPWQFKFIEVALQKAGYNLVIPDKRGREVVELGLKYVHNDVCFPAVLVVGQLLKALQSGVYDPSRTAIMYFRSGGGCRASNYTAFLRKALDECGFKQVPIMSVFSHQSPGFAFTMPMVIDIVKSTIYGDLLMQCVLRMRPYEKTSGSVQSCYDKWEQLCREDIRTGSYRTFVKNIWRIVDDFDRIPVHEEAAKPRVGIVGEIMVKYMPAANNNLVEWLESEGAEVVMPGLLSFFQYCAYDGIVRHDLLSGSWLCKMGSQVFLRLVQYLTKELRRALEASCHFAPGATIQELAEYAQKHLSLGNMNGEGWLIAAETAAMVQSGINNIVSVQPFGCLPNHVIARGMMKSLRECYPWANLCAIDYDSSLSEVNQHNRLKLMLAVAKEKL